MKNLEKTFLSKPTTVALKGILAIMVLISHLHGRVDLFSQSILGTLFSTFGYLAVSVFFFLSGYGLHEQYKSNPNYLSTFLKRRILPFYLVCVLTILIYLLRDVIFYRIVDWKTLLMSFFIGKTIVDNGWYLQVQLLLYVLFFVSFLLPKKVKMIAITTGVAIFCIACVFLHLGATWYEATFCFVFGLIVSFYKEKTSAFLENKLRDILVLIGLIVIFVATLYFGNKGGLMPEPLRIFVKTISSLLFASVSIIATHLVNIDNIITRFLGTISLEIYVLQGIMLKLFSETFKIKNDWLYMLVVVLATLIISVIMHPVYGFVNKIGKMTKRKNEH